MGAEGEAVNQLGNPDCILITNAKHPRAAISSNGKKSAGPWGATGSKHSPGSNLGEEKKNHL